MFALRVPSDRIFYRPYYTSRPRIVSVDYNIQRSQLVSVIDTNKLINELNPKDRPGFAKHRPLTGIIKEKENEVPLRLDIAGFILVMKSCVELAMQLHEKDFNNSLNLCSTCKYGCIFLLSPSGNCRCNNIHPNVVLAKAVVKIIERFQQTLPLPVYGKIFFKLITNFRKAERYDLCLV